MYNSRRGGGNNRNNASRPVVSKPNFVSGGQMFQGQQAFTPKKTAPSQQQQAPAPVPPPKTEQPVVQQVEQKPIIPPVEQPVTPVIENEAAKTEGSNDTEKKSWMNRKIPKKEKVRRRNQRLSKLLQPKNALMILHELVQNPVFDVSEVEGQFKATVTVADIAHNGLGKSKNAAKNAASEAAIRHLIKYKKVETMDAASDDGSEKMDTYDANESPESAPLPWQQVASFALYKLFDSWGEKPERKEEPKKVNSAKKMPENPSTLNPIMVINQMYPQAIFDELETIGNPPNVQFKIQCTIEGKNFIGTGPSKKVAKKLAAYAACHTLLGIAYPPETYQPPQ